MPSTLLKSVQSSSKEEALKFVSDGLKSLETLQGNYGTLFPYASLKDAQTALTAAANTSNIAEAPQIVSSAIDDTTNVMDTIVHQLLILERYVYLTIPKMEDGNNFGVTVQLSVLKQMKEDREYISSAIDELYKYYGARADLVEKCKLPSRVASKSTSNANAVTESKGGGNKEDGKTTESKEENKTVETETSTSEQLLRQRSVLSCDQLYYGKAKIAYQKSLTHYMAAIDFMDKNKEKLDKPKGSQGGGHYSSMY